MRYALEDIESITGMTVENGMELMNYTSIYEVVFPDNYPKNSYAPFYTDWSKFSPFPFNLKFFAIVKNIP